jgi:drug/metabolite transporter (DMT)-like permease
MNSGLWLPLAIGAYAIFSVNGIIDKIVVSKKIKNPVVVSFWVSIAGTGSALILLGGLLPAPLNEPFKFHMPGAQGLGLILAGSISLQLGLLLQYTALRKGEATRVVSAIGAAVPIFTLVFAYVFLRERMSPASYAAFGVLLAGAVTMLFRRGHWLASAFLVAISSAGFMAASAVVAKMVYLHNHFISSLALFGLGNIIYALMLLVISPKVRSSFKSTVAPTRRRSLKSVEHSGGALIVVNSILGGVGAFGLSLAINLGSVTLVNALRGIQYAGIFVIALALSTFEPKMLKEELSGQTMRQKLIAIGIIAAGLGLLVAV